MSLQINLLCVLQAMRLHFKFKGCAFFLRDSGFVQQKIPVDRWQRSFFSEVILYQSSVF